MSIWVYEHLVFEPWMIYWASNDMICFRCIEYDDDDHQSSSHQSVICHWPIDSRFHQVMKAKLDDAMKQDASAGSAAGLQQLEAAVSSYNEGLYLDKTTSVADKLDKWSGEVCSWLASEPSGVVNTEVFAGHCSCKLWEAQGSCLEQRMHLWRSWISRCSLMSFALWITSADGSSVRSVACGAWHLWWQLHLLCKPFSGWNFTRTLGTGHVFDVSESEVLVVWDLKIVV